MSDGFARYWRHEKPYTSAGSDTAAQLRAAVKQTGNPVMATRLKAIVLRKEGKDPQEIGESLLVADRAVRGWAPAHNASGILGLKPKPSGRPEGNPKWEASPFEALAKEIGKGGHWSVPRMQEWLAANKRSTSPNRPFGIASAKCATRTNQRGRIRRKGAKNGRIRSKRGTRPVSLAAEGKTVRAPALATR